MKPNYNSVMQHLLLFFVCFGKLGIGNENNKYGYYAKHFPNEAFYTMYNILPFLLFFFLEYSIHISKQINITSKQKP